MKALLIVLLLVLMIGIVSIVGAGAREGKLDAGRNSAATNVTSRQNRYDRHCGHRDRHRVLRKFVVGRRSRRLPARTWNYYKPPAADNIFGKRKPTRDWSQRAGNDPRLEWRHGSDEINSGSRPLDASLSHQHCPEWIRMWHLHPDPAKGGTFADDLPRLPAGHYQLFADVVDRRGFPWTLVGEIDLPQINGEPLTGDDSSWSGAPLAAVQRPPMQPSRNFPTAASISVESSARPAESECRDELQIHRGR